MAPIYFTNAAMAAPLSPHFKHTLLIAFYYAKISPFLGTAPPHLLLPAIEYVPRSLLLHFTSLKINER